MSSYIGLFGGRGLGRVGFSGEGKWSRLMKKVSGSLSWGKGGRCRQDGGKWSRLVRARVRRRDRVV